jgi:hypothetical protein
VFAFAEPYLEPFYQQAGYRLCDYSDLPANLQQRYSADKVHQHGWIILQGGLDTILRTQRHVKM